MRLSCEGSSDTERQRQRQRQRFWVHCLLRAIPSELPLFHCAGCPLLFDVRMARSCEPSLAPSREAVQRQASNGWSAPTRVAMCEMLHAQLPQQERLPGVRRKSSYVDESGLIAPLAAPEWRRDNLRSGCASSQHSEGTSPSSCAVSATAGAGEGFGDARRMHPRLECKVPAMKQAQSTGHRMDQARARFRRAAEASEKAQDAMLKAQANFEQAQQEIVQAQLDLHLLMQEASVPVMPTPQVNVSLVKSQETLTGLIENMWNPEAGPPPDQLIHAIQESGAILQTSSAILCQGRWVKFLPPCHRFCSHARPGRHWPTCFDQTCGYPGEGSLTTLNSPDVPEPSLTPTQELNTCVMVRRRTKGDKWSSQVCRACESSLTPKQNGHTCTKCQTWACSAACGRAVVSMHCCRLTGVVSHGSIFCYHSEGPGGSAAEGTLRETQNQEQVIDVWMAEAQSDRQLQRERVAPQAALQVVPTSYPTTQDTREGVETGQPTQIDMATPRAGQAESQGNAEAPDPAAVSTWD